MEVGGAKLVVILNVILIAQTLCETLPKAKVPVNKCCPKNEIVVDNNCKLVNETEHEEWSPVFTSVDGKDNAQVDFKLVIGEPDCGSTQQWRILHYTNSIDRLILLPNGKLRHFIYHHPEDSNFDITDEDLIRNYDYNPGQYCLDKGFNSENKLVSQYALVCTPDSLRDWTETDIVMKKIIDPIFHGIAIICYLTVAIIYFVMPTLRDLTGNIISTISICLIISQAADMVRIFTEFSSHVSFMIADIFCYTSLLGAFFWLNSLGYYVWKTFKSRNVFLRVTDGRKYCYYSSYAWSCTIVMGAIAVFAHFALEIPKSKTSMSLLHNQEVIGPLGMALFFTPVAFTILVNIFFYATTLQIINRMNTYGRIHHKLKHSFRMFLLIFIIMSITWLFMLLSGLKYDAVVYLYIVINAFQAPLFLYVCVFDQKHVAFLMQKTCGYTNCPFACCRPAPELEYGDEMTAMDSGIY